jgi:hypothetical protein
MSDDTTLYEFLIDNFTIDELDALAFDIGIDPGAIGGELLPERAQALIDLVLQNSDSVILGTALRALRPVEFGLAFRDDIAPEDET